MDFKKLMENKPVFYGIISGVAIIILILIIAVASIAARPAKSGSVSAPASKVIQEDVSLVTTDKIGLAIEVQALLARHGIKARRVLDGTKSQIVLSSRDKITEEQRDIAILRLVESGLVDEHIGLEIFDTGDFTSTKEDKRIRLVRAMNGELARLIRKISPIKNAQVFVSVPEQSLFAQNDKPITATVQVQLDEGERLDAMKVKAIKNLLMGAIQNLKAEDIAITDTNGNVYASIIGSANDALSKIQENDKYMQQKVAVQLDRLVGKGNYVVTVSTFLTQAPVEKTSIIYDPASKTAVNEQGFTEKLGDNTNDTNSAINAVSVYLPYGVPTSGQNSSQDRKYVRQAHETQYGVTKTQVNEYMKEGVIEEISIAVSLEQSTIPMSMTINDLKTLVAHAASPLVDPENVSIAFVESSNPILAPDSPNKLPKPEESGNHWWVVGLVLLVGLGFGLRYIAMRVKAEQEKHNEELYKLREKTKEQEKQLKDVNQKAQELIQKQAAMAQNLLEQQNLQKLQAQQAMAQAKENEAQSAPKKPEKDTDIDDAISELAMDYSGLDDIEATEKLKSWIEAS
ncbi:MAG: hypothetical protein LUE64_04440 [Candidatus Gastranaerophilales bacterium]|nr:hypothetical protein [Candidatus Gastranaerophilales bacterium]